MSIARKAWSAAAGAAGVAVAGTAIGVAQRHREIARRGAGDETPFGSLHSKPLVVVADDGIDLHVEVDEVDGPDAAAATGVEEDLTLVFVHGYSLNLNCWHFQRAGYRGRVRAVYYDQRSHGRSARSAEESCTIEQLGHDLRAVIEATVPGRCVVVGHSMGGMSIMSLAQHHPDLFGDVVAGAMLVSTTAGGLDPGRILLPMLPLGIGGKVMMPVVRMLDRGHKLVDLARTWGHTIADVVADRYAFGDDVPGHYVEFLFDMLNATPFEVVADFYPAFATLELFDHLGALGSVPTGIVCGTEDKITKVTHSRKLHSRIPGSSLLECEGAGHMVILERHEAVNAEIDDLLSRVTHTVTVAEAQ